MLTSRRLQPPSTSFRPDEVYRVPTPDGAAVALGRYHPRVPRRFAEPVILCHGLGNNRHTLDLDERHSLARYLARAGFESWVLELRGRGLAGGPIDATFDDQAIHDVATALETVRSTGAREVLWVGHSKGGLLLYAHLARNGNAPIRAGVTLGAPFTLALQPGLKLFVRRVEPLLSRASLPTSQLGRLAPLGMPPGPITRYLVHDQNLELEVAKHALSSIAADIPGGVARQFARWVKSGNFDGEDGFDYRNLHHVKIPFLMIAGTHDLLAPPLAVARAREALGGPVKLVVAGSAHGFRGDYGHGDLLFGRHAPDEIYPVVESFLASQATAA